MMTLDDICHFPKLQKSENGRALQRSGLSCRQRNIAKLRTSAWAGRKPRAANGNDRFSCRWRRRGFGPWLDLTRLPLAATRRTSRIALRLALIMEGVECRTR